MSIVTAFTDLGLAEPILKAVTEAGYTTPTPIQAKAIPALLTGEDLVGIAQTGTGKTAAFVLPVLQAVRGHQKRPSPKACRALIVAPTRELAAQIEQSVRTYGKYLRMTSTLVIGGVKPAAQIRALAKGVDIVIATPGRLLDHMEAGVVRLNEVETVILDEADHMLDMGFIPAIRRIMKNVPKDRQTMLFSATMPKPIRALAKDFLTDPKEVSVTPQSKPVDRIEQKVFMVEKGAKLTVLKDYLQNTAVERAIIFTRTKRGADRVARQLDKVGIWADAIHGNKSQNQRKRALAAFKSGKTAILVATDIAARGIDVDGVSHVVNFDLPNVPESYVHRIGRTARAGRSGVAVSLCSGDEKPLLRDIERLIKTDLPKDRIGAPEGSSAPREQAERSAHKSEDGQEGGRPKRNRRRRKPSGQKQGGQRSGGQGKPGRQKGKGQSDQSGRRSGGQNTGGQKAGGKRKPAGGGGKSNWKP